MHTNIKDISKITPMLTKKQINTRIKKYVLENKKYYEKHQEEIVFVPILIGACQFFFKFFYFLNLDIKYTFTRARTYAGSKKNNKALYSQVFFKSELENKIVILIDDIYDSGKTVNQIADYITKEFKVKEIKVITFLNRESNPEQILNSKYHCDFLVRFKSDL